jgi:hypothetical protein
VPPRNMVSNSASSIASLFGASRRGWAAGDWWAWCSPDTVDGVVAHLALETRPVGGSFYSPRRVRNVVGSQLR